MKKNILYIILLVCFFCIKGFAQGPGDTKVLADNKTHKGRKELRKESKVVRNQQRNTEKQERKATRNANKKLHKKTLGNRVKKKKHKNKEKAQPVRNS